MTICLVKSFSFGLLCVSCVDICQFASVLLSLLFQCMMLELIECS